MSSQTAPVVELDQVQAVTDEVQEVTFEVEVHDDVQAKPKRKSSGAQAKNWWFTIDQPFSQLPKGVRYSVYKKEIGEDGKIAYRGFIQMISKKRLSEMKSVFPFAQLDALKGTTVIEAIQQCKNVEGWEEVGDKPTRRGERNDLNGKAPKITQSDQSLQDAPLADESTNVDAGKEEKIVDEPTPAKKRRNKQAKLPKADKKQKIEVTQSEAV